jgi:HD domain
VLHRITFDRELYIAAMFHDTGLPSPVPHVDFTVRRAEIARAFTDRHGVPVDGRELVADAIAMHHTPGVALEFGAEAFLLSAGAGVDVFGLRSDEVPDALRKSVVRDFPRLGFKREFSGLWRAEAKRVPRGRAWYLHRFALTDLTIRMAPFRG